MVLSLNKFSGLNYGVKSHFQQFFSYIVAVYFIGGVKRRKPPTYVASHRLTCIEYT